MSSGVGYEGEGDEGAQTRRRYRSLPRLRLPVSARRRDRGGAEWACPPDKKRSKRPVGTRRRQFNLLGD
jgi:hypothetical protein